MVTFLHLQMVKQALWINIGRNLQGLLQSKQKQHGRQVQEM